MILLLACSSSSVELEVLAEDGSLARDAVALRPDAAVEADAAGRIGLRLDRPELWMVEAPGHLPQPVIVGPDDHRDVVEVRLLGDSGRTVLHFGGDVMLGRRYEAPAEGAPLIDPSDRDACSRLVVAELAPLFADAELSMVNLESVVGDLAETEAYPAKRWLLQTHPDSLAALDELGVDLVGLANNHQRDWLDEGVGSTVAALDERGLPWLGAGEDADEAGSSRIVEVDELSVGVVAFTSVDGSFVNDSLPTAEDTWPEDLRDEDAWKWEARSWGAEDIPFEERIPGEAWRVFEEAEEAELLEDVDAAWAALWQTYPELQDWVARRGHGGAAFWDREAAVARVEALDPQVDLVVAQLHMGFQFSDAPSGGARDAAEALVEAGADLVIGHHPHVLQGVELHQGKPIAWSLGNLAFDQDFLSTWRSAVLRVVVDDAGEIVELRLVPLVIDGYRPTPVHGTAAADILRAFAEASQHQRTAARGEDARVRAGVEAVDTEPSTWVLEHGTLRLQATERGAAESLRVPRKDTAALPQDGLVAVSGEGLLVGRDLWSFGSFQDEDADGRDDLLGWSLSPSTSIVHSGDHQRMVLQMEREQLNRSSVTASFTARVTLPEHRLWSDADGQGLDGEASYSVRMVARGQGDRNEGIVHVTLLHFDDIDPTLDPVTTTLHELELPLEIRGWGWQEVLVDLPAEALEPVDGLRPNAAIVKFELPPPPFRSSLVQLDEIEFVEWRPARGDLGAYRRVRSADGSSHTATVELLPW